MMKSYAKKSISILLSLLMLLSVFGGMSLANAEAANDTPAPKSGSTGVLLNEDFENGWPEGWTKQIDGSYSEPWTIYAGGTDDGTTYSGSYNALAFQDWDDGFAWLYTPTLDFSGFSALTMSLAYRNHCWGSDCDAFFIYYRVNAGEWVQLFATDSEHDWTKLELELPADALAANVQIGFKAESNYGYGVCLDAVKIADPVLETIALINAIGTVEYTDACKAKIDAAKDAYDALTDDQKTLVTNHTTLTDAETAYAALEAAAALAQAKLDAKEELANYKNEDDYRPAEQDALAQAIRDGKAAIDAATDTDAVASALAAAKEAIDDIKTDAELTAEELAAAKTAAKEALDSYKNASDYRADEQAALAQAIRDGKAAIDAATDTDAVASALAAAKAAIDDIKTDAEYAAEEQAAADAAAADAVEAKIAAIGKVTYTAACKAKIDDAQAAFDALTDTQKALVENAATLTAAAKKYAELKAEAEKPAEPDKPTEPEAPEEESDKLANILTAVMELVKFICLKLIPFIVSLTK